MKSITLHEHSRPLGTVLPWLMVVTAISIAGMLYAAIHLSRGYAALAAGVFSVAAIIAGWQLNAPIWNASQRGSTPLITTAEALRSTSRVTTLVYAWGAVSMFLLYDWAGLSWRHGWQYALAMACVASCLAIYVDLLADESSSFAKPAAVQRAIMLAALQGIATSGTLVWLIGSGKLSTLKGDWAANNVFLAGGLAVICLSAFAVRTQMVLDPP